MLEKKRKVGRPKKIQVDPESVLKDPHDPTQILRLLGFDPIIETIKTLREVDSKVRWIKKQSRPSQAAVAALMATKRALNSDLLKFGYRSIPEKIIQENHNFTFGIKLTDVEDEVVKIKVTPEDEAEIRH